MITHDNLTDMEKLMLRVATESFLYQHNFFDICFIHDVLRVIAPKYDSVIRSTPEYSMLRTFHCVNWNTFSDAEATRIKALALTLVGYSEQDVLRLLEPMQTYKNRLNAIYKNPPNYEVIEHSSPQQETTMKKLLSWIKS